MIRISNQEYYLDQYGKNPTAEISSAGSWETFEEGAIDSFLALESEPMDPGLPSDDELLSELGGTGDSEAGPEAEALKTLADLKKSVERPEVLDFLSESERAEWLAKIEGLSEELLRGDLVDEEAFEAATTLVEEWRTFFDETKSEAQTEADSLAKPRKVDEKKKTAIYDVEPVVTLRPDYEDKIKTHEITASEVTLKGATLHDSFVVSFDESDGCYVVVSEGENEKGRRVREEFRVTDSQLTSLIIPSGQVDVSALTEEQLDKLRIGIEPKPAREVVPVEWPKEGIQGLVSMKGANGVTTEGDNADYAVRLAERIDQAVAGEKTWDDVKSIITTWYGNGGIGGDVTGYNAEKCTHDEKYMNDVVRKVVNAIFRASKATSDDDPRFFKLLQKLPQDVRMMLIDWVTKDQGELGEKQGGDRWSSQETAESLQASIDDENGKEKEKPVEEPVPANEPSQVPAEEE